MSYTGLTGWGRGAWGDGAWDEPTPIPVTLSGATGAVGSVTVVIFPLLVLKGLLL